MKQNVALMIVALGAGTLVACDTGRVWIETGGWEEPGFEPEPPPEASACGDGVDVEFSGQPMGVLADLSGTRVATASRPDHSTAEVTFVAELPAAQSWWQWTEREGLCWATLTVQPSELTLTVDDGRVTSGERVTVLTPGGAALLVVELEASAALLGGNASERVFLEISRTSATERGVIRDANGQELLRW